MLKRFCNKCGKELSSESASENRYRMTVGITKVSKGVAWEVFNGDFDFCPDCMANLAILDGISNGDKEKADGKGFEEVKPEDC